jgi:hypothetical protein
MRSVVLATGVVFAIVSSASSADAQFRGSLTFLPSIPSAGPRPAPTLHPIWWHWSAVALPESLTPAQLPIGDAAPKGGVQLDIQPWSAQVYVDGALAGRVEQFRGYYQPLELSAGPHTIAVVAPGREPFIFGVMVVPGRTFTQRASLSWAGATLP